MVQAALNAVDVDIRPTLLNNIVLTGGGSLLDKLAERLHTELATLYPNPRIRVHASNIVTDRKYGSWVGGSILASLGTFHQVNRRAEAQLMMIMLTQLYRCGSQRRSTRSTDLALLRRDASNETWAAGEQGVQRALFNTSDIGLCRNRSNDTKWRLMKLKYTFQIQKLKLTEVSKV